MLNDRLGMMLTFIIPLALIFIWGLVFGKIGSGSQKLRLAFVNLSDAPISSKIESALDSSKTLVLLKSYQDETGKRIKFDTSSVQDYVKRGRVSAALVIPVDAYTDTSSGLKLKFYYDPKNDFEMQLMQGVLQQTIMSEIPDLFLQGMQRQSIKYLGTDSGKAFNDAITGVIEKYFSNDKKLSQIPSVSDTSNFSLTKNKEENNFFQNILQIDNVQLVGQDIANPWATRNVGGWAMMFLLFTLTATSSSLFDEKKSGVILRILASPISRVQILWSKYLFNMSLGFIQLSVLFLGGALMYKINIFSNIFNLALIIAAAATACTAFGMLLAAVSRTAAQANGLGMFLILSMSSIGGAWFPTAFMPDFIQTISKGTIVYWAMDGIQQVLWRGVGTGEIVPNIAILLGMAILITSVSIWQFKKGRVF